MKSIMLLSPDPDSVVSQQTPEQKRFSGTTFPAGTDPENFDWLQLTRSETPDHTMPAPILFRWRGVLSHAKAECAEDRDFLTGKLEYAAEKDNASASVHSLKVHTTYYWRVSGFDCEGNRVLSPVRTFRTADETPRWIRAEGVSNVRDCGGWHTKDGHLIRQGLLFRGGEMNRHMTITPAGTEFLEKQIGLRTVLDLRNPDERALLPKQGRALSPAVGWITIPLRPYSEIFSGLQKEYYAQAFRLLTKEYLPLYFHCWGGADRTGTFALLLNAVLGVEDELLLHDYELTSLSIWGERSRRKDYFQSFLSDFEALAPNSDLEAKARAYFRQCGITEEELCKFKNLMLE